MAADRIDAGCPALLAERLRRAGQLVARDDLGRAKILQIGLFRRAAG